MNKKYVIIEFEQVSLVRAKDYNIFIAILSWLVSQLNSELNDKFKEIEFGIVKTFGKFGGAYPAIAIYSDTIKYFDAQYNLIESVGNRLFSEKSAEDLVRFITESGNDWAKVSQEIMED